MHRLTSPSLYFAIRLGCPSLVGILLCVFCIPALAASVPDIRFETPFDRSNPASHQIGGVNSIVQDRMGFIWLAGENGVGRYDGRNLKLYQANSLSARSLPASYVRQIVMDNDGVLWLATEGGLARYHVETDDFSAVSAIGKTHFAVESVSAVAVAADNTLYAGSARGLYVISPDRSAMEVHRPRPPITLEPNSEQIRGIGIDARQRVWLATAGMGVAIYDPVTDEFEYLLHDSSSANSLLHNSVTVVMHDNLGRAWLGTYGGGISRLDPDTGEFTSFTTTTKGPGALKSNVVWDITQDSEGMIWAALDQGGLAYFDEDSQSFHHYLHEPYNPNSLISNQLRVVYEDSNKDLWFGAFPSGVNFYNRSTRIFSHYISRPDNPASLSHNAILRFKEAHDGTVWIGTEGGLNALDPNTHQFRRYLSDPANPDALKANAVLAIEEDIDGRLWIGTWAGGLHRFDPSSEKFRRYSPDPTNPASINSTFIWDIIRDSEDNIWIATETGGVARYDRSADGFDLYEHNPEVATSISGNYVSTLMEDSKGKLWLGTYTGLDIMNRAEGSFQHLPYETGNTNATNSKNIKSVFEDSRGNIWIGTSHKGVNILNPESGTLSYLDVDDGLPSSTISSILEDERGDIWLATTNGLARITYPDMTITRYAREDGLAGSNFNRDASLKDKSGRLYFGSAEGITTFHPDDLDKYHGKFPLRITNFRILNREVSIAAEGSPLRQAIIITEEIKLSHRDTMFAFDFAALDYRNNASIQYSYMLEGFDQHWHDIGKNSTATYTNIQPGKYTFRVRASNTRDEWTEGQTITITIASPLWRTWWAYCLYAAVLALLLYYRHEFVKLRIRAEVYKSKSITDPLTNLYNRLGIAQVAEGIFANAETKKGACLMLLDIDHFKRVNDRRGHDAGDRVLTDITAIVRKCIRSSDHFGRWGGEEFILLCATVSSENSRVLAEKIRVAVESHTYEKNLNPLRVTVSIGVADIRADDSFEGATKRADLALYKAKALGRNCVVLAD